MRCHGMVRTRATQRPESLLLALLSQKLVPRLLNRVKHNRRKRSGRRAKFIPEIRGFTSMSSRRGWDTNMPLSDG